MPSSSRYGSVRGGTGCPGRSGDSPPQLPIPVHGRCAGILSPLLSWGKGFGLVPESALAPEQNAKPRLNQEMVMGIERHPRPSTTLHCGGCVCLFRLGCLNPGREYGARESKAKEKPALPQIFSDATERSPKALLRKQRRSAVGFKSKASVKAQHLLRNPSLFRWLLFLLALA